MIDRRSVADKSDHTGCSDPESLVTGSPGWGCIVGSVSLCWHAKGVLVCE